MIIIIIINSQWRYIAVFYRVISTLSITSSSFPLSSFKLFTVMLLHALRGIYRETLGIHLLHLTFPKRDTYQEYSTGTTHLVFFLLFAFEDLFSIAQEKEYHLAILSSQRICKLFLRNLLTTYPSAMHLIIVQS